ncbi:MAG: tetratricopeptide repeat protein, partial [Bacillota bacterium]
AASEIDRAKSYVEEALDIYGGDAVAYRLLAEILEAQGDTEGAREAVRKSVQIDPSDALARSLYERLI